MRVHSIRDAAVAVRGRRTDLKLSQAELAERVGVSRKWIYEFESGKPRAEFGLVIRVLEALGLSLDLDQSPDVTRSGLHGSADLDALLDKLRLDDMRERGS